MGALAGLVLIETASRVCGEYAGKLLADLGAEVIKVEPPSGAATRQFGPFHQGESTLYAYLNTGKRVVTLDLAQDRTRLDALLANAHGMIDDHLPGWCREHRMTQGEIATAHPHLVHTLITPFGQQAPEDWQIARPLNVINAGGWAWHTPSETAPDKAPLKGAGRFLTDYEAGIDAAIATLASLRRQRQTGAGQFIDISEVGVQLNRIDCVLDRMLAGEQEPSASRHAYDMGGPGTSFATKDGHVFLLMTTKAHWLGLVGLMGKPEWASQFRDDWLEFDCTPDNVARFRAGFTPWMALQEKLPITVAAQKAGVPMVPVNTAADLPKHEQFKHRSYFQDVDGLAWPGAPYRLSATPVTPGIPAGGVSGGHLPLRNKLPPASRKGEGRKGPLSGLRILELTKVWAGPYAGKLLAALGAEVIKLESMTQLDEMRAYGGVDINSAPYFLSINQEILSVQANLKTPEGLALVHRMVAVSDVVIDNIRPGAMERSKLGYDDLRKIKPDLIQCSIKMWGNDGPLGYQTGYAPCFAALSGLTALVGHEGETPKGMNIRYGDSTAGACAVLGVLAAVHHRDATGEGQFIDLSAVESLTSLIGDSLHAYAVTGQVPQSDGNVHAEMSPHGVYACADGQWISIAVASDTEWQALRGELGLENEPRWQCLARRQVDRLALDAAISSVVVARNADELAAKLRSEQVSAFRAKSSLDLCSDDFLWASGAFRMVSDHTSGSRPVIGPSWRMKPDEAPIERGAPQLGEHNDYVYRELLGLSAEELADLIARKIIT